MASGTAYRASVHAVLYCLLDSLHTDLSAAVSVTEGAVVTVQGVYISLCCQRTMTLATGGVNDPVVMGNVGCMIRCSTFMAGIARYVWPGSDNFCPDDVRV